MIQHINDADIYYEEYGQGDLYILASMQIFDPHRKGWPFDLADEGFHVFLIQVRGYGQSTHIYENYNNNWYDVWADDVWAFARAQGIPHFLYTGQSDGAAIGWHLCFRHPEVLIGFAGLAPGPHSRENLFVTPPPGSAPWKPFLILPPANKWLNTSVSSCFNLQRDLPTIRNSGRNLSTKQRRNTSGS